MTRILFSGLSGRTGQETIKIAATRDDIEIAAGIRREICGGIDYEGAIDFNERTGYTGKWYRYKDLNNITRPQPEGFDILVDFSHEDVFEQVLEKAVRTHVPLISGTSILSERHRAMLYDATNQIPVFRGAIFDRGLHRLTNDACCLVPTYHKFLVKSSSLGHFNYQYYTQHITESIRTKLMQVTGKDYWEAEGMVHEAMSSYWRSLKTSMDIKVVCTNDGADEPPILHTITYTMLPSNQARDILEIAKVMAAKPIKKGEFYDLDEIWDDLPH